MIGDEDFRAKRRIIHARWRRNNRAKIRAIGKEYYRANRKKRLEYGKRWRMAHQNEHREMIARWKKMNPDKVSEQNKRSYLANAEDRRRRTSEWKKNNPSANRASSNAYRAGLNRATPKWVDREAIKSIYKESETLSKSLKTKLAVDHIYPLKHSKFCGLHVPWNLQILTASKNASKKNRIDSRMLGACS
jgi:hypothetical protein